MSTTVTLNIPLDGDELEAAAETLTVMAEHCHRLEEQGDVQLEMDAQITARPLQQPGVSGAVETDANGIPWDERIHARTKSKAANGTWRKKRGVPDEIIAAVEAEIKLPETAPPPPPVFPVVETPVTPVTPPVVETPPPPPVVETPPPPPVVETPPPPPVVETPVTPPVVETPPPPPVGITTMKQLVDRIKAENIQPPVVMVACNTVGVVSLPTLGAKPDLIPQVATALGFV